MAFDRRRVYYGAGATDLRKVSKEGSSLSEMALVCGRFFAVGIMLSEDSSKLGESGYRGRRKRYPQLLFKLLLAHVPL